MKVRKGLVMGFRIANRNGRYGMRAFCDHCGVEVKDDECNVLTLRRIDEGDSEPITIACKVHCTDAIDPKRRMANQELGQCVLHLTVNANIDVAEEMETAQMLHRLSGGML